MDWEQIGQAFGKTLAAFFVVLLFFIVNGGRFRKRPTDEHHGES